MKIYKLVYLLGLVSILSISPLSASELKHWDRFSGDDLPLGTIDLNQASGKVTYLRVSEPNDAWGPRKRQVKSEVIIKLSGATSRAYGFQLRMDDRTAAYSAMFELLKDAFKNNWTVNIDFIIPRLSQSFPNEPGWDVGYIKRVAVQKSNVVVPVVAPVSN